jgi:general secretion pathway protein A
VDQPSSKPSLADDPAFLASLADLEAGLGSAAPRAPAPPRRPPPPASEPPTPPSAGEFPALVPPISVPAGSRRPLLDLFPVAPAEGAPSRAGTPGAVLPADALREAEPSRRPSAAPRPAPYEAFYGLQERPFALSTDPRFLYHSAAHDRAAQDLLSAIRRREPLVVLTGPIGMGKTILCRAIVDELDRHTLTSLLLEPFVAIEPLLQTVLLDFGVISRDDAARARLADASREELFGVLREFIATLAPIEAFAVIVIDEAQNFTDAMLEEVHALVELDADQRALQVVLAGQPSLTTRLRRGDGRQLQRLVAVRTALEPLGPEEIGAYVAHRLDVAEAHGRVELDPPAIAALFSATAGVPRAVNLVCDRALTLGHESAASVIDQRLVLAAAHDLGVAPPRPERRSVLRGVVAALVFATLMAVGAGAAAWVFRDTLSRAIRRWESIPSPPSMINPVPTRPANAPPPADPPPGPRRG